MVEGQRLGAMIELNAVLESFATITEDLKKYKPDYARNGHRRLHGR